MYCNIFGLIRGAWKLPEDSIYIYEKCKKIKGFRTVKYGF